MNPETLMKTIRKGSKSSAITTKMIQGLRGYANAATNETKAEDINGNHYCKLQMICPIQADTVTKVVYMFSLSTYMYE